MKTAISVPDETFDRAERLAEQHGMNRSQFYSAAADRYADELESANLTAANADESAKFAIEGSRRVLDGVNDDW